MKRSPGPGTIQTQHRGAYERFKRTERNLALCEKEKQTLQNKLKLFEHRGKTSLLQHRLRARAKVRRPLGDRYVSETRNTPRGGSKLHRKRKTKHRKLKYRKRKTKNRKTKKRKRKHRKRKTRK